MTPAFTFLSYVCIGGPKPFYLEMKVKDCVVVYVGLSNSSRNRNKSKVFLCSCKYFFYE